MHCYVCGKDVDTSDMHGVVAFETFILGHRWERPHEIVWAHRSCEERERGVDLTFSDRFEGDYLSGTRREAWLEDEAEAAEERRQAMAMGGGSSFLNPAEMQRTLKR